MTLGAKPVEAPGRIRMEFLPSPSTLIEVEVPPQDALDFVSPRPNSQVTLLNRGIEVETITRRRSVVIPSSSGGHLTFSLRKTPFSWAKAGAEIEHIIFHLPNFEAFISDSDRFETVGTGCQRIGYLELSTAGWKVTLKALGDGRDIIKALEEGGGYGITHVGLIEKEDGTPIKINEAEEIVAALSCFLSFARGYWTSLLLPVGLDRAGDKVWEEVGFRHLDRWQTVNSWFDSMHGGLLQDVFPGFMQIWQIEDWQDSIRGAIYWYLFANKGGNIDAKLIVTQTALELLAWNYCVTDKGMISAKGFDDLCAADRLRLLLSSLSIPTVLPAELPELMKRAKGRDWDAPQAFTQVRNSIVHPQRKTKLHTPELAECWKLGLWLLELALLRLFDHNGGYGKRLTTRFAGGLSQVPWAPKSPP